MKREEIINFIKTPGKLDGSTLPVLEKLVQEYPYFQSAEILYALNLSKENNFRFNTQLKVAAVYASDRAILKQTLHQQPELVSNEDPIGSEAISEGTVTFEEVPTETKRDKTQDLVNLVDLLKNEVSSILSESSSEEETSLKNLANKLEGVIRDHEKPKELTKPDIKDYNFGHLEEMNAEENKLRLKRNEELIDKFIREEPRIEAPPKAEFFDPIDFAKHGLEDKQEIVSETLAKIHLSQGNVNKAIMIYEKLCLVYPEKSSFFAAQIEKIKKDRSS